MREDGNIIVLDMVQVRDRERALRDLRQELRQRQELLGAMADEGTRNATLHTLIDHALVTGWGPLVGMGATLHVGTDMYACTVVRVHADDRIELSFDYSKGAVRYVATARYDGRFRRLATRHSLVTFIERHEHQDPDR